MFDRQNIVIALSVTAALMAGFFWLFAGGPAPPAEKALSQGPQRMAMPQPQKPQPKKSVVHPEPAPAAAARQKGKPNSVQPKGVNEEIISKLELQGVARENALRLRTEQYAIADNVFEHLSKASNWMPELQKAASSVIVGKNGQPSMLRIYDVAADSVLREFGIEDGDVVALINGEVPVFSSGKAIEYTQKAYGLISDLQVGKPVSITVLRNGRPVNLVYQKP